MRAKKEMTNYRSINPFTEEEFEKYETLTDKKLLEKLGAAEKGYKQWSKTSLEERKSLLNKLANYLNENSEHFADIMTKEMGKPIKSARLEVRETAQLCKHYAQNSSSYLSDKEVTTEAQKSIVRYEPQGPILAIMPWNFPLWQVIRFAAPNLMAGNVGLVKPSENTPSTAKKIEEAFRKTGYPKDVFQTICIDKSQVSQIIKDDKIRGVTLTGSTRAGKAIAAQAGQNLKKTVLELGGSDPMIVFQDADIHNASENAAISRLANNGQSCTATKRMILHEDISKKFVDQLKTNFNSMTIGDPSKESTDIGPLARKDLRDNLAKQVDKTVEMGAEIVLGGRKIEKKGYFYEPTILTNIPENSPAEKEELFGPAVAVFTFSTIEEAVKIANNTRFGLGASIWTEDEDKAIKTSKEIEAGIVAINDMVDSDARLPFGGVKDSGYGRELGEEGIKEFTNRKTVYIK